MKPTIKDIIIERYGSIDNFMVESNIDLGRAYLFRLLNNEEVNPTILAIMKLAKALGMDPKDIASEYSNRHRDFWSSDK